MAKTNKKDMEMGKWACGAGYDAGVDFYISPILNEALIKKLNSI